MQLVFKSYAMSSQSDFQSLHEINVKLFARPLDTTSVKADIDKLCKDYEFQVSD